MGTIFRAIIQTFFLNDAFSPDKICPFRVASSCGEGGVSPNAQHGSSAPILRTTLPCFPYLPVCNKCFSFASSPQAYERIRKPESLVAIKNIGIIKSNPSEIRYKKNCRTRGDRYEDLVSLAGDQDRMKYIFPPFLLSCPLDIACR